jgi:REP element-mobilizing transposase RayT
MPDHIHAFVGLRSSMSISDLVRDVKNNSSNFINDNDLVKGKFSWQEGYAAFSYSHSQLDTVYKYILNQEKHHKRRIFKAEN